MAKKKKQKTAQAAYSEMDGNYEFALCLPKSVYTNAPLLRRLQARVGDLLIERGLEEWLVENLQISLQMLSVRFMCEYTDEFVRATIAAEEEDQKRMGVTDASFEAAMADKKEKRRRWGSSVGKRARPPGTRATEVGGG